MHETQIDGRTAYVTTAKVGRGPEIRLDAAAGTGDDMRKAAADQAAFAVTWALDGAPVSKAALALARRAARHAARSACDTGKGTVQASRSRRGTTPRLDVRVDIVAD